MGFEHIASISVSVYYIRIHPIATGFDMEKIDKRLEVLLTKREKTALKRLAEHDGISMGHVIRNEIRKAAKRKKVWR